MTATIHEVEEYWDRRPCNIRHSAAAVGSERWSDEVTARKYFVESHIPGFAQFHRWRDKDVLEIGCGIGTDTMSFLRAGVGRIHCVDLSQESIDVARQRIRSWLPLEIWRKASIYCMNAEEWLPASNRCNGFDLAYAFGVLHHTPSPETVARKIRERLRPGGEFRLMLYAKWSLKNLLGQQPEAQAGCPIARVYTVKQARALLEGNGFTVLSIEKTHIFPWRIADYVKYRYVKEWYYRWMPQWLWWRLESWLGWHLLIVARKDEL